MTKWEQLEFDNMLAVRQFLKEHNINACDLARYAKKLCACGTCHFFYTALGNCLPIGGFCTAVQTSVCEAERSKNMSKGEERNSRCKDCMDCFPVTTTNGIRFRGCFHKPYKGKWVSEIEECPKEQEHDDNPPMEYFESGGR